MSYEVKPVSTPGLGMLYGVDKVDVTQEMGKWA